VWQQKRDEERLATRVEVTIHGALLDSERGSLTQIMVTAINHGENIEDIDDVEIESAGPDPAGHRHIQPLPPLAPPIDIATATPTAFDEIPFDPEEWPRELRPRSSADFGARFDEKELEWLRAGLIANVRLASGHIATSGVQRVIGPDEPNHERPH
jgi:hypothetical protein